MTKVVAISGLLLLAACGGATRNPALDVAAETDTAPRGETAVSDTTPEVGTDLPLPLDVKDGEAAGTDLPDAPHAEAIDPDLPADVSPDLPGEVPPPPPGCPDDSSLPDWIAIPGEGTHFMAQCNDVELVVSPMGDGIIRLRYAGSVPSWHHSYSVVEEALPDIEVEYGEGDGWFVMCTAEMRLAIAEDTCRIELTDLEGNPLIADPPGGGHFEGSEELNGESVKIVGVTRSTPQGERFYGFGEKTGPLDKRGLELEFWNTDKPNYPADADPLYQSIPFFIGLKDGLAYGILTDNSYRMRFDMAHSKADRYTLRAFGGAVDQYVIAGPAISTVVDRYTRLTGRPAMPPRWTLGYHQCRWSYSPDSKVMEICQQFRERGIPADGIWLDIDYMDQFKSWTWEPDDFPAPGLLVGEVEKLGFKVTAIIDPGLKVEPGWDIYDEGVADGHFLLDQDGEPYVGVVWPGPAVFPDFTRAETRTWWGGLVTALTDHGVRGIWLDMNEPASFLADNNWTVPGWVKAYGDSYETTMAEIHNVYALVENMATYAGLLEAVPDRRPFLLTRAGFAGIQRYAAVWTGDAASSFEALKVNLPMMLGMGLSGVPFVGSDVGGWEGSPTPELYARWIAVGALSPFYRSHVQTGTPDQEPWSFGEEVEDISRIHITWRYRLLPYFYTLFRAALERGKPLLRPMVYEFQDDLATHDLSYQAMLGPWLLAAPVVEEGADSVQFYLPAGKWLEFHSGALEEGPATVETGVTLQALPLWLREGAIVPMGPEMMYSDQAPLDPLTFELFPGPGKSSFTVYEDDGDSMAFQDGVFHSVEYTLEPTATGARFSAGPASGSYPPPPRRVVLHVRRVDLGVEAVTISGETLSNLGNYYAIEVAEKGYFYDQNDLALWVVFPDHPEFVVEMDYDATVTDPSPTVLVPVKVNLPPGTPAGPPIHIATSATGWTQQTLEWSNEPFTAEGLVPVPRGEWFEYKYTRGDWDTVEKWAGCEEADNRYAFGKAHPVKEDEVAAWADLCP